MNNSNVSAFIRQHRSPLQQQQQNPNVVITLSNSINTPNQSRGSGKDKVTSASQTRNKWPIKRSCKATFASCLFTSIAMTVGILIVCFTTPKPSESCESSFKALIDANSLKYNSKPRSIAAADFNHDIFIDLVIANSGTNTIGIFLNYGNSTFAPQITFFTGNSSRPPSVVVGDFNNDTHLDVAVANYDTHNTGIFLGYGNGTFASQIVFSTGASRPVSLAVGDLNNDHWLDMVVVNHATENIGILFGYGNGSFANQITYSTGYDSLPYSVVLGDLNNDLHLDIAVANYGTNNVGVFLGYGNGSFAPQMTYSTNPQSKPYSIALNDFNHDGQLDIAVANSGTNDVGIFLGYRNGSFISPTTYSISPGSNPHSIIVADFNQDNQLDIAVSNYDTNNVSVLIGYGNGSFATPTMHSTGIDSGPFGMAVIDFDTNNQSDIAVVNFVTNNVFVLIGYDMMQSENPTAYSTDVGSSPYQIVSGDFNDDTEIDLVVVNQGTNNVGVFLGYGNGGFGQQITYSTVENFYPYALTVGDLDNDHRLDIVVASTNAQSVGILYGLGNATFTIVVTYFTGDLSASRSVTVNDFNNDNYLDIAFADYGTHSIGILLGYGNRSFANVMTCSSGVGSRPYSIATGDFNNDDRLDITVACYGTDSIVIFLGLGNGTFTLFTVYSTGDGSLPFMVTIADLNKDSHLDIIVANINTNNIGVFFGFGNASFATQLTYSTGLNSQPVWVSVADFNNDQALDLAAVNANNQNVGVFFGNGNGSFGPQATFSTGYNSIPFSMVVGDFNKDNRLDIAVANGGTNNITILLGHPRKGCGNQAVDATDTGLQSSSITVNQLNQTTTNCTIDHVPVLLGDYYASFRNQTTYSTGSSSRPYSIAVGDLNNDTRMDLVVANSGDGTLGIFFGYGKGTFTNEAIYSLNIGSNPQNVIVNDFNKDNVLDVAVTNPRNDSIIVLLGNGNGSFSTELTYSTGSGSNPNALTIGDFNEDNHLDLLVANKGTDTIDIFFGLDYTVFAKQNSGESGENSYPYSIAIGDFNNDGHLDIVSAFYATNNMGVFLGYGNGTFTSIMTFGHVPESHPRSVTVGNFNNDNHLDIAVAFWGVDSVGVLLGYGNGSFANPILYSIGYGSSLVSVAVGDFNNDHCLDIITANYGRHSIGVLLGYRNGTFQSVITFSAGKDSGVHSVTVADINNDSQQDIIVANYGNNNVGVFLGYGNGSFAAQMAFSTGTHSAPWSAITGDFNKDGRLDLAVANWDASNVGVLYGYGNGTLGNLQIYSTGINSKPTSVEVADFNNDGQLDIIVGDYTLITVGVFFGYSDGTFASVSTVPIEQGSYTYSLAVGDFNSDNRLDFAYANAGNNNIQVLLASGSKPFGGQTTFFIGEDCRPSSVAVGRFNNDNHLDIAVANLGTDNIGIFLGYGNRLFSNISTYSTGSDSHPVSLAVGDFNNDSLTDIVVANYQTNDIVVLMAYGNGSFSSSKTYSMGTSAELVSIDVGNFNRDNQLDIVIANFDMNNVCVLFGSGNGTFTNQTWYPLGYDSRPNWAVSKDLYYFTSVIKFAVVKVSIVFWGKRIKLTSTRCFLNNANGPLQTQPLTSYQCYTRR